MKLDEVEQPQRSFMNSLGGVLVGLVGHLCPQPLPLKGHLMKTRFSATLGLAVLSALPMQARPPQRPTSSIGAFRYQADRSLAGTLLRYEKSNLDGTRAAQIYIYMPSPDRVEVLKVEPGSPRAALVKADLDWSRFSVKSTDSWHLHKDGKLTPQAASVLDASGVFTIRVGKAEFPATVGHFPVHNYNFDLTSLNLSLPFLVNPQAGVELGIVEPDWARMRRPGFKMEGRQKGVFVYRGKIKLIYQGQDLVRERICRKYVVKGPGLSPGQGTLWVDAERGFMVAFEHPKADNPAWNSFKFTLQSEKPLSVDGWTKLQAEAAAALPGEEQ